MRLTSEIANGSVRKRFRDGTHRAISPEETLARARVHAGGMGITRLANVTGLDSIGIPVVMAIRPNSRSLSVAQGKGLTLPAAMASALMEAIETYHAENITLALRCSAFYEMLSKESVVDIDLLPRPIDGRYRPDVPVLWIEGLDWMQEKLTYVPYQVVHTAYTTDMMFDLGSFYSSTTGLASGNHLFEAVSHAICEIVERDATLLASLESESSREVRRLDLNTVDDPDCHAVMKKFEAAGVAVAVWETTRDVRIPSFQCAIGNRHSDIGRSVCVSGGAGCHPVRHIALLRALTEAAQSRLTVITGSRDDLSREDYQSIREWGSVLARSASIGVNGTRNFLSAPTHEEETFEAEIAWEFEQLQAAGVRQVIVVDLTKPEINLPVVRVVIPGLESSLSASECVLGLRAHQVLEGRL